MSQIEQSFIYQNFTDPLDKIELFLQMNSRSFYNAKVLIILRLAQYTNLYYINIVTIYLTITYCLFFLAIFKNIFSVYEEQYCKYYRWRG